MVNNGILVEDNFSLIRRSSGFIWPPKIVNVGEFVSTGEEIVIKHETRRDNIRATEGIQETKVTDESRPKENSK